MEWNEWEGNGEWGGVACDECSAVECGEWPGGVE